MEIQQLADGNLFFPITGPEWDVLKQPVFLKYIEFSFRLRYKDVENVWGARMRDAVVPQFRYIANGGEFMSGKFIGAILARDERGLEGPFLRGRVVNAGVFLRADGLRVPTDFEGGEEIRPRFEALREEIIRLVNLLSRQPEALPRLANLSDADVEVIKRHFREIHRWALVYSGREIDSREMDAISNLLDSEDLAKVSQGKRLAEDFLRQKKAKDALQILYLNQYSAFLRQYGFLGDEYRGPRGACSII